MTSPSASGEQPVIEVRQVSRSFRRPRRSLRQPGAEVHALRAVELEVPAGARLGVVGESGSGKTTLLRLIAGLDQPTSGRVAVTGTPVSGVRERDLRWLRRTLQVVFQDPMSSLDPRMRVGDIVAEPLDAQQIGTRAERRRRVAELLESVHLPADSIDRYPHQFSGGQRQRISIARALAPNPAILLADEPVSALDVSVRAQVLAVLDEVVEQFGLTMVFVSHDLSVVRRVCDRVAVMRGGEIVETGPTEQVFTDPQHPYTRRLLAAVPDLDAALAGEDAAAIADRVRAAAAREGLGT